MKVQISDIDESVWRRARVAALGSGQSMGEFVGTAVTVYLNGAVREKPGDNTVRIQPPKPTKTSPTPISTPTNTAPVPELKEGYGWCKGCGVNPVKLPGLLCKECQKEAGEKI